jgi:ABC-2 type transport system ATP-binding protein
MPSEALVTVDLTRRFGARTAVDHLNLRVEEGDLYGFLGPNGAGKTTAIRCMLGLISKDGGQVRIFGETDPVRQRQLVGAIVETPAFQSWRSAVANLEHAVAYSGRGSREDIERALQLVGLKGREHERVGTYSLGMRQRLGIARALVGRPRLLILDEPTNGLDPRGMVEVRELLLELARTERLTIFVSSHLLAEVEMLCGRVGILNQGKLVAEGRVSELLAGKGTVQEVEVAAADMVELGRALSAVQGASIAGDGEAGRLRVALQGIDPAGLNRALIGMGLSLSALVPVQRRLEDLYLSLTSRELT